MADKVTAADPRDGLPELPESAGRATLKVKPGTYKTAPVYTADQMRAMYERGKADALAHARPEAGDDDSRRLDALEADIAKHGPLILHNGEGTQGVYRGLGLSNTGRTLRQVLDALTPDQSP